MKKKNKIALIVLILLIVIVLIIHYTDKSRFGSCDKSKEYYDSLVLNQIKNKNSLIVTEKDIPDKSTEGGDEHLYKDKDGTLIYAVQNFYGETGKSEVFYYLDDNIVKYIEKKNYEYLQTIDVDPSGQIKSTITKKYYFDNRDNVCKYLVDDKDSAMDADVVDLSNYLLSNLEK